MKHDRQAFSFEIKAEARRLGFPLCGITTPDPPLHLAAFENWLAAGRHGEMAYLASERSRQRRAEPRQVLPECRSIVVLAAPYHPPAPPQEQGQPPGHGKIAAYAWGADYHDILPKRMQALVAFIEERHGSPVANRCYTDTGPLLERDLAQRAGLGWIGKNTCLINPQIGSTFFLVEILLEIDLEPDPPFEADRCGSCTRCIEACPTGCILPDRTLDARRCISYLTIELKDAISSDLRPLLRDWLFGCDVCQQVCPWNRRFASQSGDPTFSPHPGVPGPDLLAELSLTTQDFQRKFQGSPVKRARRSGYLRNTALAVGNAFANTGESNSAGPPIAALSTALQKDPEPLVRGHAAWALGRIGGETARQALLRAAEVEQDSNVIQEIHAALL
jgi:epoxyqueuosine reductase